VTGAGSIPRVAVTGGISRGRCDSNAGNGADDGNLPGIGDRYPGHDTPEVTSTGGRHGEVTGMRLVLEGTRGYRS
jgi:hypothetical protein